MGDGLWFREVRIGRKRPFGRAKGGGTAKLPDVIEARETNAPQAAPASGGRDPRPGGPARRLPSPKVLFAAAAALVVVVAAVVAALVLTGGDDKKTAAGSPQLQPVAYTPDYDVDGLAKLARRDADRRPLTEAEVFGADARTVRTGQYSFTLAGSQVSADCNAVTWGQRLQADLAKHGCSQIARGAYVSADRQHVGQFIVINLNDVEGARQILRDLDPATDAGFVRPLEAKGGPAFAKGFSAAYARAFGHYATVVWVQRAGGAQPANLNEMINVSLPVEKPADFVWGRLQMAGDR